MYKIILNDITNKYEYDELIKVFLKPEEYTLLCDADNNVNSDSNSGSNRNDNKNSDSGGNLYGNSGGEDSGRNADFENCAEAKEESAVIYKHVLEFSGLKKNPLKQAIFKELSQLTGRFPEWGIHTGVRPVKLVGELLKKTDSMEKVVDRLKNFYLFSDEKLNLVCNTYKNQQAILNTPEKNQVGLYIGIPFCPTRCLYCSFTSNQSPPEKIEEYLEALHKEIAHAGVKMKELGWYPESVYIGGGTPTTLTAEQLKKLLYRVNTSYDLSKTREFTLEAGRPDTITLEKLMVIKESGVGRISINPQTMKDSTLELIGRNHSSSDILKAFETARAVGIPMINADIIAGLPGENTKDFENTLDTMIKLGTENITVHNLAVKRASRLIDADSNFHYKQADVVREMLALSKEKLSEFGYKPYYLYRQKHMAGSLENVGYSKDGCEGVYNIRIMEEQQSIVALGAGGISKAFYPEENRLERVPNVSNFEIYISRLEQMLQRKDDNLFRR